jgi:hypothetical protein
MKQITWKPTTEAKDWGTIITLTRIGRATLKRVTINARSTTGRYHLKPKQRLVMIGERGVAQVLGLTNEQPATHLETLQLLELEGPGRFEIKDACWVGCTVLVFTVTL